MKLHVAFLAGVCSLVACAKKAPPNITGTFEGPMEQTFLSRSEQRPMTMGSRFSVTLSDEQATSTAVRLKMSDTVGGGAVTCDGRATRTDRDDGASYAFPSVTCHFANPDGTPRYQSPQCQIQSQAVGLRFDRAANRLTLDVGGLDVAFTATPAENADACNRWLRAQGANGTALTASPH